MTPQVTATATSDQNRHGTHKECLVSFPSIDRSDCPILRKVVTLAVSSRLERLHDLRTSLPYVSTIDLASG